MPFGRHNTYNDESLFVSNHFVPTEDDQKSKELDEVIKKFRLYEKKYNKSQRNSLETIKNQKKQPFLTFQTKAGRLICRKNHSVIDQYEEIATKYTKQRKISEQTFREIDHITTNSYERIKPSGLGVVNRLYPSPAPQTNKTLNDLIPKYSILFKNSPDLELSL